MASLQPKVGGQEDEVLEGDEMLNLWEGFKEVVKFIDDNERWLNVMLPATYLSS